MKMVTGGLMTKQIYYSFWGTEKEEHKNYFTDIANIADWIGYALIGARTSAFTGEIITLSNIQVMQTKEKFGSPRVYVSFSSDKTLEDAQHYRYVYQTAIQLWPHYEKSIVSGMDYPEYLYTKEEEIEKHIDGQAKWLKEGKANGNIDNSFYVQRMEALERQKEFIKKVCIFT